MRRFALRALLALTVLPLGFSETARSAPQLAVDEAAAKLVPSRVLFITADDCLKCDAELHRLRRPGGDFDKMRSRGWKIGDGPENHVQIVSRDKVSDLV